MKESKRLQDLQQLPQVIEHDILLRLPAKSLIRFKLVTKEWCCLISSEDFVKTHLKWVNEIEDIRCAQLAISTYKKNSLSLYTMDCDSSNRDLVKIDFEGYCHGRVKLVGSCNGLLLVYVPSNGLFLCNPSIREYKKIEFRTNHPNIIGGLGYDSTNKAYKAVITGNYIITGSGSRGDNNWTCEFSTTYVKIYNLKSDSWSEIDDFPYTFFHCEIPSMVNEAPHWVVLRGRDYRPITYVIIYLDLVNEKFKEVPLPDCLLKDNSKRFELGVLRGCLCISYKCDIDSYFEIWSMREYGVKESWTKLFVLTQPYISLRPLCFTRNYDEVIMHVNDNKLVMFNLKGNTKRVLAFHPVDGDSLYPMAVVTYVESLIFPEAQEGREAKGKTK
jgi:F-box interacting protein